MLVLHPPGNVFSLRHAPSWLLLAFGAGAVNSIGFFACARFVTHVTGTVSRIGIDAFSITLALDYTAVLACFILGAMVSAMAIDGRHHRKKTPLHALPLVCVALIMSGVGIAGTLGYFGTFGGSVEGPRDFVFLSLLSFAMGLQNAAVSSSTGNLVRTTHMTGPATDLGVHLASTLYVEGELRRNALRHAALRAGKLLAFAVGGGAGAILAPRVHYGAFFVPSAVVFVSTLLSFVTLPAPAPAPSAPLKEVAT